MTSTMTRWTALRVAVPAILVLIMACSNTKRTADEARGGAQATAPDPRAAAEQGLASLRQLVNESNYRELGFESPREVDGASLGEPLPVVFVGLDSLRTYQAGGQPERLLSTLNQASFPVLVNQAPRSSVVVQQQNGGWRTSTLGNGALARLIHEGRRAGANREQVLVHVGALGLHFVGHRMDNRLMLTPLTSDATFGFRAGSPMQADSVFARLATFARTMDQDAPS